MTSGSGEDILIGGADDDFCDGGANDDILVGDCADITFYELFGVPKQIQTIDCESGGNDTILGGEGNDYIIAGGFNDNVTSGPGMDLVLGDHGIIQLYNSSKFRLKHVNSTDFACSKGADIIDLGSGDDICFGGSLGDEIKGGDGSDIICGDFCIYDAEQEFFPNQHFQSIIKHNSSGGDDKIYGGNGQGASKKSLCAQFEHKMSQPYKIFLFVVSLILLSHRLSTGTRGGRLH
jgi:Ca2+-binding RTX toxin-like protein